MLMLKVFLLSSPCLLVSILIWFVTMGLLGAASERSGDECFFLEVVRSLLRRLARLGCSPLTGVS